VLVYFVSGNPGLIDYYQPFLSTLRALLESSQRQYGDNAVSIHLKGRDLAGFDDEDHDKPFTDANPPLSLEDQIRHVLADISLTRVEVNGRRNGTAFDDVIIIGHSVGSFITLEVFNRHLQAHPEIKEVNLRAAILLFPTVTDIAKSPSGRKLDLIRSTPFLDRNAHRVAKGFVDLVPASILHFVVRRVMGFPPHAADVTLRFLRSRDGIWQAIHMGKDEMRIIRDETWAEEIWEIAEEAAERDRDVPKFFFFFGKGDHWVAEECRDEFIKRRHEHAQREGPGHKRGRTRIVLDEDDIPHAFCISESPFPNLSESLQEDLTMFLQTDHSEQVAEKVAVWIGEVLDSL
jgi:pimeloyl-ACP methyl ester carboxylesterase